MKVSLQRILPMILLLAAAGTASAATKPEPPTLIPLEPLGVPAAQPKLQAAGATLYTIHFVDDTHLLLTYLTRGLMPRLPDADASDYDGLIAGVLLELPSGREIARTEWRVRDRNTYLWPLGHGRFLFRIRSTLTVLDPLRSGFKAEPFGSLPRRIGYITTSPDADLIAIETLPPLKHAAPGQATVAFDDEKPTRPPVEIYFFRLSLEGDRLEHKGAGALAAANLIAIPANASGFLKATKESAAVYDFDFVSHDGKTKELAPFDTSCFPHAHWINRSEFVALGCEVNGGKATLAGFNLRGENAWINVLSGQQLPPSIVPAPDSGRFAFGRVTLTPGVTNLENLLPEEMSAQEVSVFQSYDGRLLQKVNASPIQRAGQNFDLSPSGSSLAVIQNGAIAIYKLPALTTKDQAELKRDRADEPPANTARVQLTSVRAMGKTQTEDAPAEVLPGASEPTPPPPPATPTERTNVVGDIPVERRKPPTLYDPDHPPKPGDAKPKN